MNRDRARKLAPVLAAFLGSIATLPFDEADAQAVAGVRAALQRQGQPIGAYDVLYDAKWAVKSAKLLQPVNELTGPAPGAFSDQE